MTQGIPLYPPVEDALGRSAQISSLQFGPCWCRGVPNDSDAFDFMRLRTTVAELPVEDNILIVSARVVEGAQRMVLQVYEEMPAPTLVIRGGLCFSTSRFWDRLPGGWVATDDVLPIDIQIDDCIAGRPEALLVSFMRHLKEGSTLGSTRLKTATDRVLTR